MRRFLALALVPAFLAAAAPAAHAQVVLDNPWLERRILNIAHQGGENEAPSNTLFALKTAVQKGADVLEIDVHATADRHIVTLHDATVNRTTNGSGRVDATTLADIKRLDAAYWFVPGCGTCHGRPASDYAYRGLATGAQPFPTSLAVQGFTPNDFTIPTLREILETFRGIPINIEIKNTYPDTKPYERQLALLLKEFRRQSDVIIVSFLDHAVEQFKLWAPKIHTATATVETALFKASHAFALPGLPNPRYVALQVPMEFEGIQVVNPNFIREAHENGLAVHVWTINDRATMERLIDWGVDGIMTDHPTLLEEVLDAPRFAPRWSP